MDNEELIQFKDLKNIQQQGCQIKKNRVPRLDSSIECLTSVIVVAPMFTMDCLRVLLSGCDFMASFIDVYKSISLQLEIACRVPRNERCTTRNLLCMSIHSDIFWNYIIVIDNLRK